MEKQALSYTEALDIFGFPYDARGFLSSLPRGVTESDVKSRFRELTKKYHPDLAKDIDKSQALESYKYLAKAKDILLGKDRAGPSEENRLPEQWRKRKPGPVKTQPKPPPSPGTRSQRRTDVRVEKWSLLEQKELVLGLGDLLTLKPVKRTRNPLVYALRLSPYVGIGFEFSGLEANIVALTLISLGNDGFVKSWGKIPGEGTFYVDKKKFMGSSSYGVQIVRDLLKRYRHNPSLFDEQCGSPKESNSDKYLTLIERQKDWQKIGLLREFHEELSTGSGTLTSKQRQDLERALDDADDLLQDFKDFTDDIESIPNWRSIRVLSRLHDRMNIEGWGPTIEEASIIDKFRKIYDNLKYIEALGGKSIGWVNVFLDRLNKGEPLTMRQNEVLDDIIRRSQNPSRRRRQAMAANYVPITREEMEEYLREISRRLKATVMRKAGTEGVYALALNPFVGVRISTSLGQTESVVGVGKGAINVCLMGIQGERGWRVINGKAGNKSRVNRTTNWKKNLFSLIQDFIDAYDKSPDFYDRLGGKEVTKSPVAQEQAQRIERIQGWDKNDFLRSLHDRANGGRELSELQIKGLERAEKIEDQKAREVNRPSQNRGDLEDTLNRLRELYKKLKNPRDRDLLKSLAEQAKDRGLSPKQMDLIKILESR